MSEIVDLRSRRADNLVKIEQLVGRTIIIRGFETRPSAYGGEYVRIVGTLDGQEFVLNTASVAIRGKLEQYAEIFSQGKALRAKVVKRKNERGVNYYDLEAPDK